MFQNFPQEILAFVSKTHCKISARKETILNSTDNSDQNSKDEPSQTTSKRKSKSKSRSNSRNKNAPPKSKSSKEERKKKNPRIKVNGKTVIESDIEEKKLSS